MLVATLQAATHATHIINLFAAMARVTSGVTLSGPQRSTTSSGDKTPTDMLANTFIKEEENSSDTKSGDMNKSSLDPCDDDNSQDASSINEMDNSFEDLAESTLTYSLRNTVFASPEPPTCGIILRSNNSGRIKERKRPVENQIELNDEDIDEERLQRMLLEIQDSTSPCRSPSPVSPSSVSSASYSDPSSPTTYDQPLSAGLSDKYLEHDDTTGLVHGEVLVIRKLVIAGIVTAEKAYLDYLYVAKEYYRKPLLALASTSQSIVTERDADTIFYRVEDLYALHSSLHEKVETVLILDWGPHSCVGDFFVGLCNNLKLYKDYVEMYRSSLECLKRAKENPKFKKFLDDVGSTVSFQYKDVPTNVNELLRKPIERLQSYSLIITDLCQYTPETHRDFPVLKQSLFVMSDFIASTHDLKTFQQETFQQKPKPNKEELLSALMAYERAIKEGCICLTNKKIVLMGPPCTGKTAFKALLFNWSPPRKHHSTPIATRPIRAIERIADKREGKLWVIIEPREVYRMLADAIHDNDEEQPLSLPQEQVPESSEVKIEETIEIEKKEEIEYTDSTTAVQAPVQNKDTHVEATDVQPTFDQSKLQEVIRLLEKRQMIKTPKKALRHKATWVHVLDSGGQPQFADISRAFLRGNAVNIITLKLTEKLSDKPRFTYSLNGKVMNAPSELQMTNMQLIEHFIRSVGTAKNTKIRIGNQIIPSKPFFVIIGTYFDQAVSGVFNKKENTEESIADKNHQLLSALGEFRDHFIFFNEATDELIFPVDNLVRLNRKKISTQIRDRIMSQKGVGFRVPIPIRWYMFELQIRDIAFKTEHGIISLQSCYDIGANMNMNKDDVKNSLLYYDSLTLCLYYRQILPNVIFTNPQYLLDILSNMIRISFITSLEEVLPEGRYLSPDDQRLLREDGVFKESLLDTLDLPFIPPLFTKNDFFKLLQYLRVIAPLDSCSDSVCRYFMPIVLPPDQLHLTPDDKRVFTAVCDPIIIKFKTKIVPQGIFPSLVVSLVSRNEEPRLFIDSRSPTFSHQRRYAVKLYSEDLSGCVLLIDRMSYIEVYFTGFPSWCPTVYSAVQNAIISSGQLLGYDVAELEVSVFLACQRDDHRSTVSNMPHPLKIVHRNDSTYSTCTIETELAPLLLTDRQQCWCNDDKTVVFGPVPHLIPTNGILNESHGPVILSSIKEVNVWEVLGIYLGIKYAIIEEIKRNNHHQIEPSRKDMIYYWLQKGTATCTILCTALEALGKKKTASQLPLDTTTHSHDSTVIHSLKNTLPEGGILNEEHASIILRVLGDLNDWEELGINLELSYPLIEQIRKENPLDVVTCRMIMIVKWLQKGSATKHSLISALKIIGKNELISKLQQLPTH